jgi:hypothetical protein
LRLAAVAVHHVDLEIDADGAVAVKSYSVTFNSSPLQGGYGSRRPLSHPLRGHSIPTSFRKCSAMM